MGANTSIEWCDYSFNPWWGCIRVSPGCEHCYAETWAKRTGQDLWGPAATTDRRLFGAKHWNEPQKWAAQPHEDGRRRRVFCASMADVFEDHPALAAERAKLWDLIADTTALDWLLLTKRPENVLRMVPEGWREMLPRCIWLGTSVENQAAADKRIPHLLQTPAAVRFLSCEPLLGPLDLTAMLQDHMTCALHGRVPRDRWTTQKTCGLCMQDTIDAGRATLLVRDPRPGIDWVIAGGESGPGARPAYGSWFRTLRDQCVAAGVPFFFKQWGEHDALAMRVGKKVAGRLLDGRTWDELPEVSR